MRSLIGKRGRVLFSFKSEPVPNYSVVSGRGYGSDEYLREVEEQ